MRLTLGRTALIRALDARGWKQADLAKALGVPDGFVSRWVTGDRVPNLENALAIEGTLGISPALWTRDESELAPEPPTDPGKAA